MSNIGKVFRTKMSDGSMFRIKYIRVPTKHKNNDYVPTPTAYGYYIGHEHIMCPLGMDRLLPQEVNSIDIFEHWLEVRNNRLKSLLNKQIKELENKN